MAAYTGRQLAAFERHHPRVDTEPLEASLDTLSPSCEHTKHILELNSNPYFERVKPKSNTHKFLALPKVVDN
jgi:hypothetical protein